MGGSNLPPVYTFIAWVVILGFIIAGTVLFRWRRPDRYSRYQLKLTVTFILFLLVPSVPLVYVAGTAVDQLRTLVVALPVDDALDRGLDVLREALRDEESRLVRWHEQLLGESDSAGRSLRPPDFTMSFERDGDDLWQITGFTPSTASNVRSAFPDSLLDTPPDPRADQRKALDDAEFFESERIFFLHGDAGVYMALVKLPESEGLQAAGILISKEMVEARFSLENGLTNFRNIARLGGRTTQQLIWVLASMLMVLLTIGSFLAARILARGVSDPVVELAKGMEAVAAGDLSTKLEITASDEMRILVDSFNNMTSEIRESRERIIQVEKQAAWRDVAQRIAHEIKNPLTPIQIGLHRVRSRLEAAGMWNEDEAIRESFRTMNEEVEALRRMAATFSDFAQLPQPEQRKGDLETVVRSAMALFQEGPHNARMTMEVRGQVPPVSMDADLVKRAMINLVKNAVESVEEAGGGSVMILLERQRGELLLQVKDSGIGFASEDAPRLFNPEFTTKTRGTGLGLSIVSRIVADHAWRIEASSDGPGSGVTMNILIPLEDSHTS
ncbi:PAS domain-containing sensor histidine kinase [Gemmatimonadota bacterium]